MLGERRCDVGSICCTNVTCSFYFLLQDSAYFCSVLVNILVPHSVCKSVYFFFFILIKLLIHRANWDNKENESSDCLQYEAIFRFNCFVFEIYLFPESPVCKINSSHNYLFRLCFFFIIIFIMLYCAILLRNFIAQFYCAILLCNLVLISHTFSIDNCN